MYPINVKMAEPIKPNVYVINNMTPQRMFVNQHLKVKIVNLKHKKYRNSGKEEKIQKSNIKIRENRIKSQIFIIGKETHLYRKKYI